MSRHFLVRRHFEFERRHDLVTLSELASRTDPDFRLILESIMNLDLCCPAIRYRGTSVTRGEVQLAFEAMKLVRKFIRAKLGLR